MWEAHAFSFLSCHFFVFFAAGMEQQVCRQEQSTFFFTLLSFCIVHHSSSLSSSSSNFQAIFGFSFTKGAPPILRIFLCVHFLCLKLGDHFDSYRLDVLLSHAAFFPLKPNF